MELAPQVLSLPLSIRLVKVEYSEIISTHMFKVNSEIPRNVFKLDVFSYFVNGLFLESSRSSRLVPYGSIHPFHDAWSN